MSDTTFIRWARNGDVFSDREVYEESDFNNPAMNETKKRFEGEEDDPEPEESEGAIDEELEAGLLGEEEVLGDGDVAARGEAEGPSGIEGKKAEHKPYVKLDPLWVEEDADGTKPIIGTFGATRAANKMRELGYLFLCGIVMIITSESMFVKTCVQGSKRIVPDFRPRKDRMHPDNLQELIGCKLIEDFLPKKLRESAEARRRFLGKYRPLRFGSLFTVPKSNDLNRVVFNGVAGNDALNSPPYFTFFSPWDIVSRLRKLGTFHAVTCDIKAWFYRIPMHMAMARYYAVNPPNRKWMRFSCVPMGASVAPAVGQAATWAMILYRDSPLESSLGIVVPKEGIPAICDIVEGGAVVGHIFVCLDNIAVVHKTKEGRDAWWERLERNAKVLGIHPFKEHELSTEANFSYIGVQYCSGKWRHQEDRVARWRKRYGDEDEVRSSLHVGNVQNITGVLVWDRRLRNLGMKSLRSVFRSQAEMTRETEPREANESDKVLYAKLWRELLANEWQDVGGSMVWPLPKGAGWGRVVIVTDASDTKWSWLVMERGKVRRDGSGLYINPSGSFPSKVVDRIYYKEMYAILLALEGIALEGVRNVEVTLVGDSKAVIGSLSKLLAPPDAWWMMDKIEELCLANGFSLNTKWVESDGNVAHSATHDELITEYRSDRSWLIAESEIYVQPEGGRGKRNREGQLV